MKSELLAIVRVRGGINITTSIEDTLKYLNLHNKNWCVVLEPNPSNRGMILKVKDYVTWGEISLDVMKELVAKRATPSKDSSKNFVFEGKKYQRWIRLSPPKKGYGRKGVKTPFSKGGALGYRKEKINDLLTRMI